MSRPRAYLTGREKAAMLRRQGYACAHCDAILGPVEYDHTTPHALLRTGHKPDSALCHQCHLEKTRVDVRVIAKVKRIAGEKGQYARRKKRGSRLKSQGFRKDVRRTFSGEIEERKPR